VNTEDAARRWADVWTRAWPSREVESMVALYARNAKYLSYPFRDPDEGVDGVRSYLTRTLGVEDNIECWFAEPVASGDRAAVEWWASWTEEGEEITLAGTSLLRFDDEGLVVDQRDYWNQFDGRRPPYPSW
jgi:SnoaL-like domain